MPSVLFVCTANICRSPMAAALFNKILKEEGFIDEWIVESAGTWSLENQPAAEKTQKVLRNRGLDVSGHSSRRVSRQLLASFDLILTMEEGQKEALRVEFPEFASKIFLLSEVANAQGNIDDPIGLTLIDFEDTAKQLESYLEKGFNKIVELTKN
jgi:protein-tyrosine-phosphatase